MYIEPEILIGGVIFAASNKVVRRNSIWLQVVRE